MDVIRIRRLELDCIVGVRPQEREHRQRVRLDVGLHADLSPAGRTGRISLTADYDQVAHEVAQLLSFRHYHLIEMAAEEVSAMLLGVHSLVHRIDLRIEKPGALEGRARAASVEVRRTRKDFPANVQLAPYGQHEILLETREARLELLRLEPGKSTNAGPGFAAQGLYWLLSGSIDGEGGSVNPELPAGANFSSSDCPSPLHNPGPETACLFRCWKRTLPGH
jgi:FolB domain-containing protein